MCGVKEIQAQETFRKSQEQRKALYPFTVTKGPEEKECLNENHNSKSESHVKEYKEMKNE